MSIPLAFLSPVIAQISWAALPFFHGFLAKQIPGGQQFGDEFTEE